MAPRVDQLVSRFRMIDAERMRDLPIYNSALQVEAIDFQCLQLPSIASRPSQNAMVGALITPWFINIILMDIDDAPAAELGQRVHYTFPSGEREFMAGEDEELGRYDFISLASPVLKFKTQQAAQALARRELEKLLSEADDETAMTSQYVNFDAAAMPQATAEAASDEDVDLQRRQLLRGRLKQD